MKNSTINYYDLNAQKYAESTINVKISESLEMFCKNLPEKARVLDVGCGSGRDSLYFKSKGFNVTAIDASAELAKFASKQIGQEVLIRDVKDLGFKNEFDAVWCMASLLHLKKDELPLAIKNCIQSLKVEEPGFFFASFKIGNGSGYDENGRFFSYYQKEELKEILENTQYFEKIQFQENEDKLGRNEVSWISFVAQKKPNLILDYNIKNKFK
jgi:SAM-dependent methyltransferase